VPEITEDYMMRPDEAVGLEWDSLLGEVLFAGEDIKQAVEARQHELFRRRVNDMRVVLDELEQRMAVEAGG